MRQLFIQRTRLIVSLSLLIITGLQAVAFTVHDLVNDKGYYAIQLGYFSKEELYPDYYNAGSYDYPDGAYGIGRGFHFEYVKDRWGDISEYYVKAVGLRIAPAANGLESAMVDRDFYFAIAKDPRVYQGKTIYEPTDDGKYLVLYNDATWYKNPSPYYDEFSLSGEWSTGVCSSGDYMIGALHNLTYQELDDYIYSFYQIAYFYNYWAGTRPNGPFSPGAAAWRDVAR